MLAGFGSRALVQAVPGAAAMVDYPQEAKICAGPYTSKFTGSAAQCHRGTLDLEVWVCPALPWMAACW